jgi:hypothetical protein
MVWTAVGEALSTWGKYEDELGRLFGILISGDFPLPPCDRAFGAVRTFEARVEMLREAGRAYFEYFGRSVRASEKPFLDIAKEANEAVKIRNDFAHGVVMPYTPKGKTKPFGFCLLPPRYDSRRDVNYVAKVAYDVPTIKHFITLIKNMTSPPHELGDRIIRDIRERRGKSPPRWPV